MYLAEMHYTFNLPRTEKVGTEEVGTEKLMEKHHEGFLISDIEAFKNFMKKVPVNCYFIIHEIDSEEFNKLKTKSIDFRNPDNILDGICDFLSGGETEEETDIQLMSFENNSSLPKDIFKKDYSGFARYAPAECFLYLTDPSLASITGSAWKSNEVSANYASFLTEKAEKCLKNTRILKTDYFYDKLQSELMRIFQEEGSDETNKTKITGEELLKAFSLKKISASTDYFSYNLFYNYKHEEKIKQLEVCLRQGNDGNFNITTTGDLKNKLKKYIKKNHYDGTKESLHTFDLEETCNIEEEILDNLYGKRYIQEITAVFKDYEQLKTFISLSLNPLMPQKNNFKFHGEEEFKTKNISLMVLFNEAKCIMSMNFAYSREIDAYCIYIRVDQKKETAFLTWLLEEIESKEDTDQSEEENDAALQDFEVQDEKNRMLLQEDFNDNSER